MSIIKAKEIVKALFALFSIVAVFAAFSHIFGHGFWRRNDSPERFVGSWAFAREPEWSHMSKAFGGRILIELRFFEDGTGLEIFDDGSENEVVWAATDWDSRRSITVPLIGFRERDMLPLGGIRYSVVLNHNFGNRL